MPTIKDSVDPIQTLRLALQFATFDNPDLLTGSLTVLQELDKQLYDLDVPEEMNESLVDAVKELNEAIIGEIPRDNKEVKNSKSSTNNEDDDEDDTSSGRLRLPRGRSDDDDEDSP